MTWSFPYLNPEEEAKLLEEFIDKETGEIMYPESDGQPMSESTLHFQWITTIQGGLDSLFADKADVFVAGDLLWYPEEGKPYIRLAPDVMVAFGRPKKPRGSYEQWKEDNIPPQVVMEILSKGNTTSEMMDKFLFYEKYGVQEYYLYDYRKHKFYVWFRKEDKLVSQLVMPDVESPLMGIKFDVSGDKLRLYNPDGSPFLTYVQQNQQQKQILEKLNQAEREVETVKQQAEDAKQQAEDAKQQAEEEKIANEEAMKEIEKLKALLKTQGFDLDN